MLFLRQSEIIIIKYGSANVTNIHDLCMEIRPTERLGQCCFSTIRVKWLKLPFIITEVFLLNEM